MRRVPRTIVVSALSATGFFNLACLPVDAQTVRAEWRGSVPLETTTTDQHGQAFTVTGLSGLTMMDNSRFVAVMDNSDKLVFVEVEWNPDGSIRSAAITGGFTIAEARDFEGIAYTTAERDSVFLAEEGTPAIHEYALADSALLQSLESPAVFGNRRANFGFESLARRLDGSELWTANEEALTVDGDLSTPQTGTVVRLLRYALSCNAATPAEQYAYVTEPMHGGAITGGRSGLVELVALPNGGVLALERSFAFRFPNLFESRLYELDFAGASDVSDFGNGLIRETYTPVTKHLLWSGDVGNLEGLALGPRLVGGNQALLGIVDDGDPLSRNQLVTFELIGSFAIGMKPAARAECLPPTDVQSAIDDGAAAVVLRLFDFLQNR